MAVILAEPDFTQLLFSGEEQALVSPEPFCHGGGSAEPELCHLFTAALKVHKNFPDFCKCSKFLFTGFGVCICV